MLSGPGLVIRLLEACECEGLSEPKKMIALDRWRIAQEAAQLAHRPNPILEVIEGQRTALIVVDMQRGFLDVGAAVEVPAGRRIIHNINTLADIIRAAGGVVIFLRFIVDQDVGLLPFFEGESYLGEGRESPMRAFRQGHPQFELSPELEVEADDLILDKKRFSAVLGSNLVDVLRDRDIDTVVVTGVTTDVCAGNTAEDLMQRDFHVVMVWDGTAALDRLEHELYLARIFGLYGDVMPTEEILTRLARATD